MFKFGRYARPPGPYDKYKEPLSMVPARQSSLITGSRSRVEANGGGAGFGNSFGGSSAAGGAGNGSGFVNGAGGSPAGGNAFQGGYNNDRYNPVYDQLEEGTVLEDWIPRDGAGLDMLFRRIYLRDPTIGPGIDIIRSLPWSDYNLEGIEDKGIMRVYEDCMEALQVQLLMPDITGDYLTIGRNIVSLIFDGRKGIFSGVVPHDPDFIRVTPLPVYGFDPLCDFKLSPGFKRFLNSTDPRAVDARKALPPAFLEAANKEQGFLPLDPVSTIYMARKASQHDSVGTSLLTRVLYFWAIEKALLNAQMTSTRRRARSFIHLVAGIDNVWEPTAGELDSLAGMLIQANEDPVGGVVATRTGVTISEPVGGGADFYKWSDELELFAKYKMQAIGINDALLSGDATYNNADSARSVFVESLATLRARIVNKFFYQKLFPIIARIHGFQKRSKAELDHNIRIDRSNDSPEAIYQKYVKNKFPEWAQANQITASRLTQRKAMQIPLNELVMPTINWHKQLKPNQDEAMLNILEKLQQNEVPVTLAQWAMAAGINADEDNMRKEYQKDAELRRDIDRYRTEAEQAEADMEGGGKGDQESINIPTEESGGESLEEPPTEETSGGDAPPQESADEQAKDEQVEDLIDEMTTTAPKEEIKQSVQAKLDRMARKVPKKISDIPIWSAGKCGPLRRTEAASILSALVKKPEILTDPEKVLHFLSERTSKEKAKLLAYCAVRLNLCKLPVSRDIEKTVVASARAHALRYSDLQSKQAMLDMRKLEAELQFLSRVLGQTKKAKGPDLSLDRLTPNMGTRVFGGY